MKKARAFDARRKIIEEKRPAAEEAERAKEVAEMGEMLKAAAEYLGVDPESTQIFVCRRGR
jgi:hypothetical protein